MPTNLAKFNAALDKSASKIRGDLQKFYRQVIMEVFRRIVFRTPVDTGRARGNWQMEKNRAAEGVLDFEGSEGEANAFAFNQAIQKLGDIPPFSLVHITNNVEYLFYLEYDKRSPQHPEGMVEITLTEMEAWISGIK